MTSPLGRPHGAPQRHVRQVRQVRQVGCVLVPQSGRAAPLPWPTRRVCPASQSGLTRPAPRGRFGECSRLKRQASWASVSSTARSMVSVNAMCRARTSLGPVAVPRDGPEAHDSCVHLLADCKAGPFTDTHGAEGTRTPDPHTASPCAIGTGSRATPQVRGRSQRGRGLPRDAGRPHRTASLPPPESRKCRAATS